MSVTKLLSHLFDSRLKQIARFNTEAEAIQQGVLADLLQRARNTAYGKQYDFASIRSYQEFACRLPLITYEGVKPYVERMKQRESNLIWSSQIKWFAKSSGTTNDKSKFIPVSKEALHKCHYQGGQDCVALYLQMNPQSRFFSGKGLILGGSHSVNLFSKNSYYGDLSAILIENVHPLVNYIRVPKKEIALMEHWDVKLEAMADSTIHENITNLSGVPSWFLVLIKRILEKTGKQNLTEVWPNLEVFFHGGISFTPYREQYKELIPSDKMHYVETYNASEGFFAVQNDLNDAGMLLMIDLGIFFEFIPLEEVGKENPRVIPLWETEVGKNYAVVITTNSGLWRYQIGDTVKFTSVSPYKIQVSGRTKHFINAFGEELMVDNADKGLAVACARTGAEIVDYSAAPVFMEGGKKAHHQWMIEFAKAPASVEAFADTLDAALQELNSDYEAKRYGSIALDRLSIETARPHLFQDWLREKGKLGGQHKIPRLSNNRDIMDELIKMNKI